MWGTDYHAENMQQREEELQLVGLTQSMENN